MGKTMLDATPDHKLWQTLGRLGDALETEDVDTAVSLFQADCFWRDLVALTWNIRTMEGRDQIRGMLESQLGRIRPSKLVPAANEKAVEQGGILEGWFGFETEVARGLGHVRIRDGQIWTLLTTMVELKGHEEKQGPTRPLGIPPAPRKGLKSWKEERDAQAAELGDARQPWCLIIGGGQGGIGLAARLKQLGVPTLVVERNERAGDSWRKRYKSLCLHDPVWYDHMPYLPFPANWPVFSPKDKIGDWLEMYVKVMEIDYWGSATCRSASFDDDAKEWTVVVERHGREIVLKPKQLVFATGMASKPVVPEFPGMDRFRGDQHHSSRHPGPDGYAGKRAVVIGSNTSAHDICAALWEAGADVTMVQRSSTNVIRSEPLTEVATGALYSEAAVAAGITTERADLISASVPYGLMPAFQKPVYDRLRAMDAPFYEALERAGFKLDWGDDESGLFMKYMRRGSGYYIDVGASQLIIDGSIGLASGEVDHLTETSVVLDDGTELRADLVVYATGYGSMNGWVADLVSQEMADKVGKVWGLGSGTTKDPGPWEGEPRNMWKPTQQEALWFHGGNLHQSRHYSQFLALQLKARMEGIPTPVYGLQEVHHLS
jgi:putative flavoprotein involved in K+ transport